MIRECTLYDLSSFKFNGTYFMAQNMYSAQYSVNLEIFQSGWCERQALLLAQH